MGQGNGQSVADRWLGNGRRAARDGSTLAVQDLWDGSLAEVRLQGRKPSAPVSGGVAALSRHPWLLAAVEAAGAVGPGGRVTAERVALAATAGDRGEPPFPVPTVDQMRRAAGWARPTPEELADVSAVASALAASPSGRLGRLALAAVLAVQLGSAAAADRALETATRLSKVRCRWSGGDATYAMPADWDWASEVVPGRAAVQAPYTAVSTGMFDGED